MRVNSRLILAVASAALLFAAPAMADVPLDMTVQGRLTDAAGDPLPAGLKIFTFKIFDAEVAGAEVWPEGVGEDQTLTTDADGLWTAQVGKVLGLTHVVFKDTSRWLEITVDDGLNPAETLPRVRLNTNPFTYHSAKSQSASNADNADLLGGLNAGSFALSTHNHDGADITTGTVSTSRYSANADLAAEGVLDNNAGTDLLTRDQGDGRWMGVSVDNWVNTVGDVMTGDLDFNSGSLSLRADISAHQWETYDAGGVLNGEWGTTGTQNNLWMYSGGSLRFRGIASSGGGELVLWNNSALVTADLWSGGGGSAYLALFQQDGSSGVFLWGGTSSDGSRLLMHNAGGSNTITLDADLTGSSAAVLPVSSIQATEILDEPGISQGRVNSSVPINLSTMVDVVTTTIAIPASGYIAVRAFGQMGTQGTTGTNTITHQIDEVAGGTTLGAYHQVGGMGGYPNTSTHFFSLSNSRTYFKNAGTYTFRWEARNSSGSSTKYIWNPNIVAHFFPTSYGSVTTIATSSESSEFGSAKVLPVGITQQGGTVADGPQLYEVDLRELELKAARADAAAAKAARELREAQEEAAAKASEARLSNVPEQGDQ